MGQPLQYATSFHGIIDLLAILPTYLSVFFPGSRYLTVIRILRVLWIFRVLKLVQYLSEARLLKQALRTSQRKITAFLFAMATLVIILGSFIKLSFITIQVSVNSVNHFGFIQYISQKFIHLSQILGRIGDYFVVRHIENIHIGLIFQPGFNFGFYGASLKATMRGGRS